MIVLRARRKVNRHPAHRSAVPRLPQWTVDPELRTTVSKPRDDLSGETKQEANRPGRRRLKEMEISDHYLNVFVGNLCAPN